MKLGQVIDAMTFATKIRIVKKFNGEVLYNNFLSYRELYDLGIFDCEVYKIAPEFHEDTQCAAIKIVIYK